jgi:hypothetical protein
MTTTVKVLIEGNKKCEVKVIDADGSDSKGHPPRDVMPGSFTTVLIHGEQSVSVVETGEFIS